ncbi:5'-methylthioadenosine/adenosylhomocysteine nucleosidase [Paracidovorax wautersii]|uniref:5'-methylthioadenosine/adenosylhomocysteine nucleosidase n=1 Tax=Paracidovorax wautersii TaxID=1177982 RepID=UPI0031DCA5F6
MTIAILSALAEEQQGLVDAMEGLQALRHVGRDFRCGRLHGHEVVCALSGIGKVAAATTTAALVERFGVRAVVFTGVAGGLGPGVNVGDVVVARQFLQHDMDASPIFPRWELPGYGRCALASDGAMTDALAGAAAGAVQAGMAEAFASACVHQGLIVSGDQFVGSHQASDRLRGELQAAGHSPLAVEMEGAAVAQVCLDYGVPFAAMRTISDRADDSAHVDFSLFVRTVASRYAQRVVSDFLRQWPAQADAH